jgi:2'-5' RNA ligase
VHWVRAEGIHLTLQFYGEVTPDVVKGLQAALEQAAATVPPVALTLEGLGVFPNAVRPRVIWVGVGGQVDRLRELQRAVESASGPLGFKPEGRDYTPHLTLGRVPAELKPAERQKLAKALKATTLGRVGEFRVEVLSLMRSELKPMGAVYTQLCAAPLRGRME